MSAPSRMEPLAAAVAALVAPELDPAYRRRVQTVLGWLPPSPDARSHVLDVGCGRGYFVEYYARLGQRATTGVEVDGALVAQAARGLAGLPGVVLVQADAAALPFPDRAFSGVVLSEVLEHVADDAAVLREVFRVLRPGAAVAVTVPHARYPWAWDPINRTLEALSLPPIRRGPFAGIWAEHRRLYELATLRSVVTGAGLVVEAEQALVRRCLPFTHNLLYGAGKPLLESGWLPRRFAQAVDRRRAVPGAAAASPAARLLRAILSVGETGNRDETTMAGASVNLCVKARRPR